MVKGKYKHSDTCPTCMFSIFSLTCTCCFFLHLHQPSSLASSCPMKTICIPSIEIYRFAFSMRGLAKRLRQKRACSVLPKEARSSKPGIQPFRGMHTFRRPFHVFFLIRGSFGCEMGSGMMRQRRLTRRV